MAKILVLFAHPALEKSRVHARLLQHIQTLKGVTINDLYEEYPDFDIDVRREQQLLLDNDIIIWQHPLYWYSAPALLKQWIDLVLEHGWAYGSHGTALKDKIIFNAISSGGSKQAYSGEEAHRLTIRQFLAPFEQTAKLCKMCYLPPYNIHGTHKLSSNDIDTLADEYTTVLQLLRERAFNVSDIQQLGSLNEIVATKENINS